MNTNNTERYIFGQPHDFLPSEYITCRKKRERAIRHISSLPSNYFHPFFYRYVMLMDDREISRELNITPMQAATPYIIRGEVTDGLRKE